VNRGDHGGIRACTMTFPLFVRLTAKDVALLGALIIGLDVLLFCASPGHSRKLPHVFTAYTLHAEHSIELSLSTDLVFRSFKSAIKSQFALNTTRHDMSQTSQYLPLPSLTKLVLIYQPRRDGRMSWLRHHNGE